MNSSNSATVRALHISSVGETVAEVQRLRAEGDLRRWSRLLEDWLVVFADGPTDFHLPGYGTVAWLDNEWDRQAAEFAYRDVGFEPHLHRQDDWLHAMNFARDGVDPPTARLLLHNAELCLLTERPSQAVLHAATAAELALVRGLRLRLERESSSEDIIQCLLMRSKMLGARIKLSKELGVEVPPALMRHLAEPRNAIIHRGERVSLDLAQRSVALTRRLVDTYVPLLDYDPGPADPEREGSPSNGTGSSQPKAQVDRQTNAYDRQALK